MALNPRALCPHFTHFEHVLRLRGYKKGHNFAIHFYGGPPTVVRANSRRVGDLNILGSPGSLGYAGQEIVHHLPSFPGGN
jgi:hypothetical protein